MANSDARTGLIPVKTKGASSYAGRSTPYYVPSSYGTALYIGDPVVITGTSNTSAAGQGKQFPAGSLPEINRATAGDTNPVTGAIIGLEVDPNNLDKTYNPASTARVVYVDDDPNTIFEIQSDSANAVAATDIGSNANIVYTHSGEPATGLSGAELNTASMTTTATYQLRILGIVNRPDNALGVNAKLHIQINNHTQAANKAGI